MIFAIYTSASMIVKETSRSIIRAAWVSLLPGVSVQPIDQVIYLGSWLSQGEREDSSWERLRA